MHQSSPRPENDPARSLAHLIKSHVRELAEFPFFQLESQGQGWRVWAALDKHLQDSEFRGVDPSNRSSEVRGTRARGISRESN